MSRKIFRVVVVLVLALSMLGAFTGCGSEAQEPQDQDVAADEGNDNEAAESTEDADEASEAKTVTVNGFEFTIGDKPMDELEFEAVFTNVSIPFAAILQQGVDLFAEEYGINAYMTGYTDYQVDKQIEIIENLITKGVDGIAIAVYDPDATEEIINKCLEAGIPTVTFNADAPNSNRLGYVGNNEEEAGYWLAKDVCEAMGGEGKVIVSSIALDAVWSQQRQAGVEKALAEYPDIEVAAYVNADGTEDEGYAKVENAYFANPDITGFISIGGSGYKMSKVMKTMDVGNLNSDNPIYVSEADIYEISLEYMLDGWMLCSYSQNPYQHGYKPIEMLYNFYITGDPDSFYVGYTDMEKVDITNAQEWLDKIDAGLPVG